MVEGIICAADDLGMPDGIDAVSQDFIGTTGTWSYVTPHPKLQVLDFLTKKVSYDTYQEDIWDCEDRAFWGIAKARCQFIGCPMGAAIGKPIEGNFSKDMDHTLIVFWHYSGNQYEPIFFDPDDSLKREVRFSPRIIIPFPIHRYHDPNAVRKELPPFENFPQIKNGYFALDNNYNITDINKIEAYLRGLIKCPDSPDPLAYRFREDRAFWAFIHAGHEFKGAPIGVAFGKAQEGKFKGKDHGVIMLWKSCDDFVFWDVDDNHEVSFDPRIIIV